MNHNESMQSPSLDVIASLGELIEAIGTKAKGAGLDGNIAKRNGYIDALVMAARFRDRLMIVESSASHQDGES